jgi:uncharacterized membrane protein YeaQ/YmgE (transglycosylase-associated protein family)
MFEVPLEQRSFSVRYRISTEQAYDAAYGNHRARVRHPIGGGNMLHLLWEAIIGLIVGALAKFIMPGKDPGGIIITMLLGIAGALLAGWLGQAVGWYRPGQGAGFIASLIGALILLFIYRLFKGRRATT